MSNESTAFANITYEVVSETYNDGRVEYGIAVCDGGAPIEIISDISNDREAIESLVQSCNESQLAPKHIHDVIEDFLNR